MSGFYRFRGGESEEKGLRGPLSGDPVEVDQDQLGYRFRIAEHVQVICIFEIGIHSI